MQHLNFSAASHSGVTKWDGGGGCPVSYLSVLFHIKQDRNWEVLAGVPSHGGAGEVCHSAAGQRAGTAEAAPGEPTARALWSHACPVPDAHIDCITIYYPQHWGSYGAAVFKPSCSINMPKVCCTFQTEMFVSSAGSFLGPREHISAGEVGLSTGQ